MFFSKKNNQTGAGGQLAEESALSEEQLEKSVEDIDLPDKLSGRRLKWGYWLTANRLRLRQSWVTFLIVLSVLAWFYVGYRLIMFYTIEARQLAVSEAYLSAELIDYEGYWAKNKPRPLAVLDSNVLANGQQADFFAYVQNPNEQWLAVFDYQFFAGSDGLTWRRGWLLPGEAKYLMELAVTDGRLRQGGAMRLEIKNINWQHINKHQVPNYQSYADDRLNFEITDLDFITPQESLVSDKVPISRAEFTITNRSAYNFWQVGCQVILKSGSRVTAVNYITLNQFASGEKRTVSVDWYEQLPRASQVAVIPEVNILDSAAYFDFPGGAGELK